MTTPPKRTAQGWFVAAIGVLTGATIYLHPESLEAPAWIAYAACACFMFAGLAIVASESGLQHLNAWLGVATVACLLTPGAWLAFGPGPRACSVSLPFISTVASEWMCRGVFGFGAILVALFLVWLIRRALRGQNLG
jgi:hypothetical protein